MTKDNIAKEKLIAGLNLLGATSAPHFPLSFMLDINNFMHFIHVSVYYNNAIYKHNTYTSNNYKTLLARIAKDIADGKKTNQ